MNLEKIIRRVDDVILDGFFQPIIDRLPTSMSAWSLAMNCQLGALIFQVVYVVAPLILYHLSLFAKFENILTLLCGVILFLGFQRFQVLVRPNVLNPLRVMMRGWRLISIGFLIYSGWCLMTSVESSWLWDVLAALSQLIFLVGLYFMACQPRSS